MSDRRPICTHEPVSGRVSSHRNLEAANLRGELTASALVCSSDMCQSDAANWVFELVGVRGTFYPVNTQGGGNWR